VRPDVLSLHRFYQSPVGVSVSQLIQLCIQPMWNAPAMPLFGLGYPLPYLDLMAVSDERPASNNISKANYALMPAAQGVCHWPTLQESATALVDEYHMPIADSSIDRLLVIHAIEYSDRPAHLFREIWRTMAPGGQVIAVVPNRRRTWSALDTTPFGHGQPYSRSQISSLMRDQMLPPEQWDTALMVPPLNWPGAAGMMKVMERSLHSLGKNLGGALIISARKQVYGGLLKTKSRAQVRPVYTGLPVNRCDQATLAPKYGEKSK